MSNKRRSNTKSKFDNFDSFLQNNPHPAVQIPTEFNRSQKTFTIHDMVSVRPMTRNQERVFDLWKDDYNITLAGSAGTGKDFVSLYLALQEILSGTSKYNKIIILRSIVSVRELGALPGTLEEKVAPIEAMYHGMFDELFKKKNQYKYMKEAGLIEFVSTSFIRGVTFNNAIVIADECQNCNIEELATIVTRISDSSKLIILGDVKQNDLIRKKTDISGFLKFMQILNLMPSFRTVNFTIDDVVRGNVVKEFLIAQDRVDELDKK